MNVCIKTYGCTLNNADSDIMEGILAANGINVIDDMDKADVVVLNTCTVKMPTEQKIRGCGMPCNCNS